MYCNSCVALQLSSVTVVFTERVIAKGFFRGVEQTQNMCFEIYIEPQQNRRYAVYRFRQATQEVNETLDQFHTRLRTLAQTCSFNDVEIITAGSSSRILKKALRDPSYDLKSILTVKVLPQDAMN